MANFWQNLPTPFTILAPMDDVTDNVFRKVVVGCGRPDVFFTEFTNADGLTSKGTNIVSRKLKFTDAEHPIVAQIWGNNPDTIYKAAVIVKDKGFDGLDINMGCPIRDVVKKKAGAGLIGEFELAGKIIEAAKKGAREIPVSVKTRLGINKNIAEEWTTFLLNQGIAALTMHARTAAQMSKVPADWEEIGKLVKIKNAVAPNVKIIGNGDIANRSQVVEMHQKYNVDGVMIGRAIFDNPWIFKAGEEGKHSQKEYTDLLIKHFDYFEEENTDPRVIKKRYPSLKKFFKTYVKGFSGANILRQKLMETVDISEARRLLGR